MSSPIDFTKPLSEAQVAGVKTLFCSMPTYSAKAKDGGTIQSCDAGPLLRKIGYDRSEKQLTMYKSCMDKYYDGKLTLLQFTEGIEGTHNPALVAKACAPGFDLNSDGFIDPPEFKEFLELMVTHEPKLEGKCFAQFVVEADTNRDGKVSVDEFADWITKVLQD